MELSTEDTEVQKMITDSYTEEKSPERSPTKSSESRSHRIRKMEELSMENDGSDLSGKRQAFVKNEDDTYEEEATIRREEPHKSRKLRQGGIDPDLLNQVFAVLSQHEQQGNTDPTVGERLTGKIPGKVAGFGEDQCYYTDMTNLTDLMQLFAYSGPTWKDADDMGYVMPYSFIDEKEHLKKYPPSNNRNLAVGNLKLIEIACRITKIQPAIVFKKKEKDTKKNKNSKNNKNKNSKELKNKEAKTKTNEWHAIIYDPNDESSSLPVKITSRMMDDVYAENIQSLEGDVIVIANITARNNLKINRISRMTPVQQERHNILARWGERFARSAVTFHDIKQTPFSAINIENKKHNRRLLHSNADSSDTLSNE